MLTRCVVLIDVRNVPIKDFVKMVPSSKQNEMKVASFTNVLVKTKHINLVTLINKVAVFHLCSAQYRQIAESLFNIIWQSIVLQN